MTLITGNTSGYALPTSFPRIVATEVYRSLLFSFFQVFLENLDRISKHMLSVVFSRRSINALVISTMTSALKTGDFSMARNAFICREIFEFVSKGFFENAGMGESLRPEIIDPKSIRLYGEVFIAVTAPYVLTNNESLRFSLSMHLAGFFSLSELLI